MHSLRLLCCVALTALLATQATGCRKRTPPTPPAPDPSEAPVAAEPAAAVQAPVHLPTGSGSSLAPSIAGEPAKEAVKTQDRFNRNSTWMSKLSQNNPQLRAQVLAEIQRAGLSPAEMQELRKQAQMYGVKL